jgi:hypothetical protein
MLRRGSPKHPKREFRSMSLADFGLSGGCEA